MIHTDGVHIVSDFDLSELHDFAEHVGIKPHWYHRGRWPHYDVPKRQRPTAKAVLASFGVQITTTRGLIEAMRNGHMLDELIAEDRAIGGITHPRRKEPISAGLLDDDSIKLLQNEGILPRRTK